MKRYLTCAQMRAADFYTINVLGVPGSVLMRRAGEAIADEVQRAAARLNAKDICVVCGTGNNGGDGYVCARLLKERGLNVSVYATEGKLSEDCEREKRAYNGAYSKHIAGAIIVDCIFGTGLSRKVEGVAAECINKINSSGAFIISADIPSGLNGDSGKVCGVAVRANLTVAIGERKTGFLLGDGPDYCGEVAVCDIGIKADAYSALSYGEEDIKQFFPKRKRNSHKGTYGKACLVAGSEKYKGAAALSLSSALRSGCGYVLLTCNGAVANALCAKFMQAIFVNEPDLTADSIAVGMGCGRGAELYETVKGLLLNYRGKLIIDADGINVLATFGADVLKRAECSVLLTPHVKEFSRISGKTVDGILSSPIDCASEFAREYGVSVLLKGAASILTDGERVIINERGSSALAKAGSGDLLSGLICGSAARGLNLFDAAIASQYALGLSAEICAGEYTEYCVTAAELIKTLPLAIKRLTT